MALKLAFTLPTPALLGAATAIPTLLAAIPGAIDYWDVAHAAPVVSAGTVTQIPTVFGPDPLDTKITGAGGTRTLVSQEGRAGVQFAGYSGLSTTGFSDGELTGGFSIALFCRLNATTNSLRMFTMTGVTAASGRMVYYDQSGNPQNFNFGAVATRRLAPITGWHGLILDFDGTTLRTWDVAAGFTALGTSGTILPGAAAPAAGTYATMTSLGFGGLSTTAAQMTFGAALYCGQSLWGTSHMTTVEDWLKYKLGRIA